MGKKNQKRNGWASVPQRISKREHGWPVCLQEPGRVCSLDAVLQRPGDRWHLGQTHEQSLSSCRLTSGSPIGPGGWGGVNSSCRWWLHCLSGSHSARPPHEGWGKEEPDWSTVCTRLVFGFFLRTCNRISTARITRNVQNRSLPRLLGGGRKVCSIK